MFLLCVGRRPNWKDPHGDPPDHDLHDWLLNRPVAAREFIARNDGTVDGALDDARDLVDMVLHIVRHDGWVGVVTGVDSFGGDAATEAALTSARRAMTRARALAQRIAVHDTGGRREADAQAVLDLLSALVQRRSEAGWEAVDMLAAGTTQTQAADKLQISKQAVSQRLRAALWAPEVAGRELAINILVAANAVAH